MNNNLKFEDIKLKDKPVPRNFMNQQLDKKYDNVCQLNWHISHIKI